MWSWRRSTGPDILGNAHGRKSLGVGNRNVAFVQTRAGTTSASTGHCRMHPLQFRLRCTQAQATGAKIGDHPSTSASGSAPRKSPRPLSVCTLRIVRGQRAQTRSSGFSGRHQYRMRVMRPPSARPGQAAPLRRLTFRLTDHSGGRNAQAAVDTNSAQQQALALQAAAMFAGPPGAEGRSGDSQSPYPASALRESRANPGIIPLQTRGVG